MEIHQEQLMSPKITVSRIICWLFAVMVLAAGTANLIWIHPVPGVIYLLLSLIYIPKANKFLGIGSISGFLLIRVVPGIVLILFTLGVSDLGDLIDKL